MLIVSFIYNPIYILIRIITGFDFLLGVNHSLYDLLNLMSKIKKERKSPAALAAEIHTEIFMSLTKAIFSFIWLNRASASSLFTNPEPRRLLMSKGPKPPHLYHPLNISFFVT